METLTIEATCFKCKKVSSFTLPRKDYEKWQNGAPIQDSLYYLTPDERELLISGICGKCFDKLFFYMRRESIRIISV